MLIFYPYIPNKKYFLIQQLESSMSKILGDDLITGGITSCSQICVNLTLSLQILLQLITLVLHPSMNIISLLSFEESPTFLLRLEPTT